jgi:flavin-dependent dehydrogenase
MDTVEHLIVGAGPAGLRAAQVLAEAGREVLVAERHAEVGPKTCAGGLSAKTVRLLRRLGLPADAGLRSDGYVAFAGDRPRVLDPEGTAVVTLSRRELGRIQLTWTLGAGAEVRVGTPVTELDLPGRRARVGGRLMRWAHLIGADGSDSAVRRGLGLPSPREYFAGEYNLGGLRLEPLRIECQPRELANGYAWVFPHRNYTSVGAVASKRLVPPPRVRRFLETRMAELGLPPPVMPFEGAMLEVEHRGFHFPGGVHLVGDAAGSPSALTAEGIYPALVTGEEVALGILDPSFSAPRTASWLRVKRRHDRLARLLSRRTARAALLPALAALSRVPAARGPMVRWFLEG